MVLDNHLTHVLQANHRRTTPYLYAIQFNQLISPNDLSSYSPHEKFLPTFIATQVAIAFIVSDKQDSC